MTDDGRQFGHPVLNPLFYGNGWKPFSANTNENKEYSLKFLKYFKEISFRQSDSSNGLFPALCFQVMRFVENREGNDSLRFSIGIIIYEDGFCKGIRTIPSQNPSFFIQTKRPETDRPVPITLFLSRIDRNPKFSMRIGQSVSIWQTRARKSARKSSSHQA